MVLYGSSKFNWLVICHKFQCTLQAVLADNTDDTIERSSTCLYQPDDQFDE